VPSPIPPETRAAIIHDLESEEEESCRTIAKRHGVSDATVRKIAKDEGFADAFTRANTKSATDAAIADNRARRAIEATEALTVAAALRDKILTAAHGRDAQGWATAYGIMADKHAMFDQYDSDKLGLAAVDSWLDAMGIP
jgi:hypothetical protein